MSNVTEQQQRKKYRHTEKQKQWWAKHQMNIASPYSKELRCGIYNAGSEKMRTPHRDRTLRMLCIQHRMGQELNKLTKHNGDYILACCMCECDIDFAEDGNDHWLLRVEYIDERWYCPDCFPHSIPGKAGVATKTDEWGRLVRYTRHPGSEQVEDPLDALPGEDGGDRPSPPDRGAKKRPPSGSSNRGKVRGRDWEQGFLPFFEVDDSSDDPLDVCEY